MADKNTKNAPIAQIWYLGATFSTFIIVDFESKLKI